MASAGNNTFIEYITTPKDHFYLGPINNTLASAANVLVYNPLNNEISYTLITLIFFIESMSAYTKKTHIFFLVIMMSILFLLMVLGF